jgi:hypothetical protein
MARFEEPPFLRGETFFSGTTIDISDLTNLGGLAYEGREYIVEDTLHQSGMHITLKVIRNMSATAVLAKQTLKPDTSNSDGTNTFETAHRRCNGKSDTEAELVHLSDEVMPSAGAPQYDLFFTVVEGPTLVTSPIAGSAIAIKGAIVATTFGKAKAQDLTGATSVLGNQIQNRIGRALDALTVGQTATDFMIFATNRW